MAMDGVRPTWLYLGSMSLWASLTHALIRSSLQFVLRLILPILDYVRTHASVVDSTPGSRVAHTITNTRDDTWSNGLPDDLVLQIWTRLSVFDSQRFRSACSSWRRVVSAAVTENRELDPSYSTHGIRISPPCLLVYTTFDKIMGLLPFDGPRRYRLFELRINHAEECLGQLFPEKQQGEITYIPIHRKACLGSIDGWFIIGIEPNSRSASQNAAPRGCIHCATCTEAYIFFVNPIKKTKFSVMPFTATDSEPTEGLEASLKVVASAAPLPSTGDFILALLRIKKGDIYVCRPGREEWNYWRWKRVEKRPRPTFLDLAFGAGRRLYAVTKDMVLVFTWDPNPSKPEEAELIAAETLRVTSPWPADHTLLHWGLYGTSESSYLVPGSEGKLFLFCHCRWTVGDVTHPVGFRVFKLSSGPSPDENQWAAIESFEEQGVLLLSGKGGKFVNKSELPESFMQHTPADSRIWSAMTDILHVGVVGRSLKRWTKIAVIPPRNAHYAGWHATWFVPKPW